MRALDQKPDLTFVDIPALEIDRLENLEQVSGGGNNRVFKISFRDGSHKILKQYFRHPGDRRDRLQAECDAYEFLWSHQIRCIPEPFGYDAEAGFALFEYVEAIKVGGELSENDLLAALTFVARLAELAKLPDAKRLGIASEACFTLDELSRSIKGRIDKLRAVEGEANSATTAFRSLLSERLIPALAEATKRAGAQLRASEKLSSKFRTLSPSDFGFHNALKTGSGDWKFQDFEYFGWDDPAKLIIDFELHPAMTWTLSLKELWRKRCFAIFADDILLPQRVESLYPLYAIKWCAIFLNEFVPAYRARRDFAAISAFDLEAAQARQLAKAERLYETEIRPRIC